MAKDLAELDYDVIVVFSPHWQTYIGTHVLAVPHFKSVSVDPIFPNLFRYHYDLKVDVSLAEAICKSAQGKELVMKQMTNPDFRVDYGTIVSCHMANPRWDKPIVAISSQRATHYYNADYMQSLMVRLGEATKEAIWASGKRAVLLASHSLSHRHFTEEPDLPEDMSHEHIYNHHQYLWDMKLIGLMKAGKSHEIMKLMPDFTEHAVAETDSGALSWMLSALEFPSYSAQIYGYGTVIGTGNVVAAWHHQKQGEASR
jgi:2-aminophenol/2-amino-5-chlorophenol 1,6-dioxygenase beta subunit